MEKKGWQSEPTTARRSEKKTRGRAARLTGGSGEGKVTPMAR
jgi:hypothetical protein